MGIKIPIAIFVVVVVLVTGAMQAVAHCYEGEDDYGDEFRCLYPWQIQGELPPEPRERFYYDLKNCVRNFDRRCSKQVYNYILHRKRIDGACCQQLTQMGRGCNRSLAWTLANSNKYKYFKRVIQRRSESAFDRCSSAGYYDRGLGGYGEGIDGW